MLLIASVAVIVAVVFPWGNFQNHSHWAKVAWIPFVSPPVRLRDVLQNVLLFVPFGGAVALQLRPPVRVAAISAGVFSVLGEWSQVYSHNRFPSATDVVCNVCGAALGAALVRHLFSAHQ